MVTLFAPWMDVMTPWEEAVDRRPEATTNKEPRIVGIYGQNEMWMR